MKNSEFKHYVRIIGNRIFLSSFFFCFFLLFFISPLSADGSYSRWKPLRVVLHVHSQVSGEETTMEEISHLAKKHGIDAVILTDYFQQKVSLGMYPWHRLLKISHERASVLKWGVKRYFKSVEETNHKIPEVILIPGVEVTPFYWWTGNFWKNNLTVHDVQKNVLVFGLEQKAMQELPTMENGKLKVDAYHGSGDETPYQEVIDYVNQKGALVIWSTPDEAFGADRKCGPVFLSTQPYSDSLVKTQNFDGVAIFPEGFRQTGKLDGIWDKLLRSYCRGHLEKPVWGFAEVVGHDQNLVGQLPLWDQIVYADQKEETSILEALKKGRFYIRRSEQDEMMMTHFTVSDVSGTTVGVMGEEIAIIGVPRIHAKVMLPLGALAQKVSVEVIRNGEMVYVENEKKGMVEIDWMDQSPLKSGKKYYYRILARSYLKKNSFILSNPIFVKEK